MIEGQRTAAGGVALPTVATPKASPLQQQSAPSQVPAPSSPLEISLQFLPSMGGIELGLALVLGVAFPMLFLEISRKPRANLKLS
eukprot:23881_6